MKLSRRNFLLGSGLLALPLASLPLRAGPIPQPFATGELWGMPYVARGAQGITDQTRKARRKTQVRSFEFA